MFNFRLFLRNIRKILIFTTNIRTKDKLIYKSILNTSLLFAFAFMLVYSFI